MSSERWSFEPRPLTEPESDGEVPDLARILYPRPKWIFWDVGLTLIHPASSTIRRELEGHFPASGRDRDDVLASLVAAAEARHLRQPALLSGDERVAHAWASLLQLPLEEGSALLASCLQRLDLYCEVDVAIHSVLRDLTARGVRLGVISNSDGTLDEELAHFGLDPYFDVVVDSGRVGAEKPHVEIFLAALAQAGARPGECWHVGDGLINDYLAAAAVGMAPLLLDRHGAWRSVVPVARIQRLSQIFELPAFSRAAR